MNRVPAIEPKIDCHVHVFDPVRFPYARDVFYKPVPAETATAQQLGYVLDAHGIRNALLVGPNSGYNLDNRCLLDAIAQSGGQYKGIAVVRSDTSRAELAELKAQGVVGVAFQVALAGVDHYRDIGPLLERLRGLDMWADVQVEHDQLVALAPMLVGSGVRLVFDHCGRPHPQRGVGQPGFQALLEIAATGRAAVKPNEAARRAILWDTPRRLFGFTDYQGTTTAAPSHRGHRNA